jgi:Xaa-Pro aminopeptidase
MDDIFLNPAEGAVESLRITKDESEIELLQTAVNLADSAMEQALQSVHSGVAEIEVAKVIEACLRDLGADAVAFDTIVGTGVNGALPHHRAEKTLIRKGDPVVIDMGALFKGYRSDLTRTVLADPSGKSHEKFEEIYGIVLEAQLAAEKAAEPGMRAADLDRVSRNVIEKNGYGSHFGHGLGHGVGLDIHERPMVVPSSTDVIEIGSVFTIEPGIYLPDWGGVRIEDVVLMEESGPRVLTKSPK